MITELIFFRSSLYYIKRERESTDNDCCHSSEQERETEGNKQSEKKRERERQKETSNLRKRERERVTKHHLTIDVYRCHTSKTHKTLNDSTYELSHLYMYTYQLNRLSKFNRLNCYYCSCTILQTAVFVLYIY
jgi:hypothetical protein